MAGQGHPDALSSRPLLIEGATLLGPGMPLEEGRILVAAGRIAAAGRAGDVAVPATAERVDAGGLFAAPGFLDLQVNGGFGIDLTSEPDALPALARRLPEVGVTGFLPTIVSSPPEVVAAALAALEAAASADPAAAVPLGLHLEGPFLSPQALGAHDAASIRPPDPAEAAGWSAAAGVRLVTLAPELPGALELIGRLVDRGVVVAAGHSRASADEGRAGIEAGVRYATHLFNAMPPLGHREPGLAGALLADERVTIGLIADGVHVDPLVVALVWRLVGERRFSLVSDAVAALGLPPGRARLGRSEVTHAGRAARLADGTLAGSAAGIDAGLRTLVAAGVPLPGAIRALTAVPAALLGDRERGTLRVGSRADLVLLAPELTVRATYVAGWLAYRVD